MLPVHAQHCVPAISGCTRTASGVGIGPALFTFSQKRFAKGTKFGCFTLELCPWENLLATGVPQPHSQSPSPLCANIVIPQLQVYALRLYSTKAYLASKRVLVCFAFCQCLQYTRARVNLL